MSSIKRIGVIGAGFSGLLSCYALARKGLEIFLVDRADFRNINFKDRRAIVLSEASRSILQKFGLWQKIKPFCIPIKEVWVSEKKAFGRIKLNADELGLQALGWSICAHDLSMVISKAVLESPNVTLKTKKSFEDFHTNGKILSLKLDDGSTETIKNIDFLVGADGIDSEVRRKMGLFLVRKDYDQHAVVGKVATTMKNNGIAIQKIFEHGSLALIPSGDYQYTFIFIVKSVYFKRNYQNKKIILELITDLCGFPFGRYCSLEVFHDYPIFGSKVLYRQFKICTSRKFTRLPSSFYSTRLNLGIRDIDELMQRIMNDEDFLESSRISKLKKFRSSREATEIFSNSVAFFYGERYITKNFIRRATIAAAAISTNFRKHIIRIGAGVKLYITMNSLNAHTDILILGSGINAMICVAFCKKYNLSFRLLVSSAGLMSGNRHFTITQTTEGILKNLELWNESDEREHGYFNSIQILDNNGVKDLEFNNSINSEVPMAWVVKEKLLSGHLDKLLKKEEHHFSALRILKNDQEGVAVEDESNRVYEASLMLITENFETDDGEFKGEEQRVRKYSQFALVGDLISEKCHNNVALQWFTKDGILALLPSQDPNVYSVIYSRDKDSEFLNNNLSVHLLPITLINKHVGKIVSFDNLATYELLEKWRTSVHDNSIVWLGSAAFSFHPLAGQGLNFAIKNIDRLFSHVVHQKDYINPIARQTCLRNFNKVVMNDATRLISFINLIKKLL